MEEIVYYTIQYLLLISQDRSKILLKTLFNKIIDINIPSENYFSKRNGLRSTERSIFDQNVFPHRISEIVPGV